MIVTEERQLSLVLKLTDSQMNSLGVCNLRGLVEHGKGHKGLIMKQNRAN